MSDVLCRHKYFLYPGKNKFFSSIKYVYNWNKVSFKPASKKQRYKIQLIHIYNNECKVQMKCARIYTYAG